MVYPVRSRRSRGISIGINLFPHKKICDLDCIYCEVDNPGTSGVEPSISLLKSELELIFVAIRDGKAFAGERINDIAFSGDGEPTVSPIFSDSVDAAINIQKSLGPPGLKLVLITDALSLHRPAVRAAVDRMMQNNGEVWAKLDAGTQEYYELVDRGRAPLSRQVDNIKNLGKSYPLVVQSMFLKVHGAPPPDGEIIAYIERLKEIVAFGARILRIDIYTIARPTTEKYATALSDGELDTIASKARAALGESLRIETYYSNR